MAANKIYVIGIGYRPLDKKAKDIIYNSDIILANNRLFEIFKGYEDFESVKDRVLVIDNVNETINFIRTQNTEHRAQKIQTLNSELRTVVLLASGDPMFFGIGSRIINEFDRDVVEILPDLSSIQVAFSRIKEPWGDAFFISLHGGPDPAKRRKLEYEIKDIPMLIEKHNKIGILTDKVNNPAEIAKMINSSFISESSRTDTHHLSLKMYVCERLGYPDEKIIEGSPQDIANMSFSDPNVVIIKIC